VEERYGDWVRVTTGEGTSGWADGVQVLPLGPTGGVGTGP